MILFRHKTADSSGLASILMQQSLRLSVAAMRRVGRSI